MNENEEANVLIGRIESMAGNLRDKPIDNMQLDLLECVAHLLTNVTFQVAMNCAKGASEPVEPVQDELQPGEKCEVNFVRDDIPFGGDYWQLATVLEVFHHDSGDVCYRTSATSDQWVFSAMVRRPVEKK